MRNHRLNLALVATAAAGLVTACGGGDSSSSTAGSGASMVLEEVSNGFGQLVPHTIQKLDAQGNQTPQIVSIRSFQDIVDNLTLENLILPVPKFDPGPVLPSGLPGNHFLMARFTQDLKVGTVLDPSPGAQSNSGLTGAVSVIAVNPITGESSPIVGRAFINGETYAGTPQGVPPVLQLQKWVDLDNGKPVAVVPEGFGFPGTEANFNGSNLLVSPKTVVFIPDTDNDLSTHELFPTNVEIRLRITTAVQAANGNHVQQTILGATTVGADLMTPEIITTPPPLNAPLITPGNGDVNVDPLTAIRVEFTEPVQPLTVGDLDDGTPPGLSSAIKLLFGPSTSRTDVPFSIRPVSVFDLSVYELFPAFNFPGSGPPGDECGTFAQVDITINPGQIADLAQNINPLNTSETLPNLNVLGAQTFFVTGEGPGIVNAPVIPDVIIVGRSGAAPGLSVIDLNGFGQSTGNPEFTEDILVMVEGETNFPNNPNVRFQTGLRPPLAVGSCTIDGGSAGVFTLTKDSTLNNLVVRPPLITNVGDIMMGHSLDATFNNAQFPFGCQSGGGDICTLDGLKLVQPVPAGPNTLGPAQQGQFGSLAAGIENLVCWAPHPNPPSLTFPPLCVSPYLGADEPTSIDNLIVPPIKTNLLVSGDAFGNPLADPPIPPSGLLTPEQNAFFQGPSQGQINLNACNAYGIRQQVGSFLYVIDRQRGELTVFNSNRMNIIDRVAIPDPTSMAIGTNLDFVAVTNQQADTVTFVDIDPNSSTFHQAVKTTVVGDSPRGVAWEGENEDILVCNEGDDSLSIIAAHSLEVRRVVSSQLNKPFEVVTFPRQIQLGFNRQVYFAYVLNRVGTVAMFESGPNGVNGWGFDDIIGIAPYEFRNPKTIQADPNNLFAAAWVVHEGPLDPLTQQPGPFGEGALSQILIESAIPGAISLNINSALTPQFRSMELGIPVSIGEDTLSGVPVDIAFDNQRNISAYVNPSNVFSAGSGIPVNGKCLVRYPAGVAVNTSEAQFMFAAVPNTQGGSGVIDVIDVGAAGSQLVDTNAFQVGLQSIPAPNVTTLCDFWRQ